MDQPLTAEALHEAQPEWRARLFDRLETMWQGLQQDLEYQRNATERGADPRTQAIQLRVVEIQAKLLDLHRPQPPAAEPEPEGPSEAEIAAVQAEAVARIDATIARINETSD